LLDGKEGVDGSSPSEGSRKGRHEIEQSFGAIFADHETGRYVGKIRAEPWPSAKMIVSGWRRPVPSSFLTASMPSLASRTFARQAAVFDACMDVSQTEGLC